MFLNQIGRSTDCDNFVIPETQYIKQVQLAYNTMGVTYLKVTTDQGGTFSRGTFSQTDSAYTQLFTADKPFMGIMGYESTVLKALGFLAFKCKDGLVDVDDDSGSIKDNSTIIDGL